MIEVAAGLVFHQGRLLITQRRLNDHLGGLWEFPGGKCHPNETYEDCLQRELLEELGIVVQVGQRVAVVDHAYPEKTVHLEFFKCQLISGVAKPIECNDLRWICLHEIVFYEFPAADSQLLDRLRTNPDWWTE